MAREPSIYWTKLSGIQMSGNVGNSSHDLNSRQFSPPSRTPFEERTNQ